MIKNGNIILREWDEGDAERLAEIANNKKVYDNLRDAFSHPYSIEDAKNYISIVQDENKLSKVFAIVVDGTVAGSMVDF